MQLEKVGSQEGLNFAVCSEMGNEGGCGCFGNEPLERGKLKGREKRGTFRSDVLEKAERWDPDHVDPDHGNPRGQNIGQGATGKGREGCEAIPREGRGLVRSVVTVPSLLTEELDGGLVAGTPGRKKRHRDGGGEKARHEVPRGHCF